MKAPEPPPPTLRRIIDTAALAHNWKTLDRLSGKARAGAAVKADAYGLGVDICVPALRDAGCALFFVAHWSEVAAVARHVPASTIAVLHGAINEDEIGYAKAIGAVPVINSVEQAVAWVSAGGDVCHLMIDTGINRLGVAASELDDPAIQALNIDIVMSHLACADEDSAMNADQLARFESAARRVSHKRRSLANSACIALGTDYAFDVTRPGLALYGGVPRDELASHIKPVVSIEAAILQRRALKAGDRVGYNAEFTATAPLQTATISLGYADGFLRPRGPGGHLLHQQRALPILGKVSMDMIVVDISEARDLKEGDWLTVPFDLRHAAQQSSVSQYELLTTLGHRLKG
ncbi:MAG: alanine racemase [Pseudomonadota bacterium]